MYKKEKENKEHRIVFSMAVTFRLTCNIFHLIKSSFTHDRVI